MARASLDGSTVALLFLDLDRFKEINDTLGQAAGDQLLMITADRLKAQVRSDDVAARLGGDEFAMMLPDVSGPEESKGVAARIVEALAKPMAVAQHRLTIHASIGIALSDADALDPGELMHRADVAMYQAKRNGRGRFELFVGPPPWSPDAPNALPSPIGRPTAPALTLPNALAES